MNNQQILAKTYTKHNLLLGIIFIGLLFWVGYLLQHYQTINHTLIKQVKDIKSINIFHDDNPTVLSFTKKNNDWEILSPIRQKASHHVVNTLLSKLQTSCQLVQSTEVAKLVKKIAFPLNVKTNLYHYQLSQKNSIPNKVYAIKHSISQGEKEKPVSQFMVCDQLISIMLNAPAINFIDKSLYQGRLTQIETQHGKIKPFDGLDLSVLQVIKPDSPPIINPLNTLTFTTDKQSKRYYLLPLTQTTNTAHLFLYSTERQLIFVIAKHPKFNPLISY